MTHQYSRAERLLTRPFPTSPPKPYFSPPQLTNGHLSQIPSAKNKGRELRPILPIGPGGIIEVPPDMQDTVSRLVDMSLVCRYLAAQCQVRQGNWTDATEMLGEANPFRESSTILIYIYIYISFSTCFQVVVGQPSRT